MHLDLVTIVVAEYDPAIRFFVEVLGFELTKDPCSVATMKSDSSRARVTQIMDLLLLAPGIQSMDADDTPDLL